MFIDALLRRKDNLVVSASDNAMLAEIIQLMSAQTIGAVVIIDANGGLAGIISEREVVGALNAHGPAATQLPVRTLMIKDVPTALPSDRLRDVMKIMTRRRMRHIPVVDGGQLVGLVSIGDVIASQLEETMQENAVLQDLARGHLAAA